VFANKFKTLKYQNHKRTLETHNLRHKGDRALQIILGAVAGKDNLEEATTVTILDLPLLPEMNMAESYEDEMIIDLEDHLPLFKFHSVAETSMGQLEAEILTIDVTGAGVAHDLRIVSEILGTARDPPAQVGEKTRIRRFTYLDETLGRSQTSRSFLWTSWIAVS
jgi:hypothetical protein